MEDDVNIFCVEDVVHQLGVTYIPLLHKLVNTVCTIEFKQLYSQGGGNHMTRLSGILP